MDAIPKHKQRERAEIAQQVDRFLKHGGRVNEVPSHVMKRETGKKTGTLVTYQQTEA